MRNQALPGIKKLIDASPIKHTAKQSKEIGTPENHQHPHTEHQAKYIEKSGVEQPHSYSHGMRIKTKEK